MKYCSRFICWLTVMLFWQHFSSLLAQPLRLRLLDSSQAGVSFRGISAATDQVVWVAGSKGTVGRSTNGGQTWDWMHPEGYASRDFRDVEAFDSLTAVVMAVDSPGIILRTTDGGKKWETVYENHTPGIFLDAMVFTGHRGFCVGDPIQGRFVVLSSSDAGISWHMFPDKLRPAALPGEACFAASGSNLAMPFAAHAPSVLLVSGGSVSRMHAIGGPGDSVKIFTLNLMQGGQMTGANAIVAGRDGPIVVGGDYTNPKRTDSTMHVGDRNWQVPDNSLYSPIGYTSGIALANDSTMVLCGLGGVAVLHRTRGTDGKVYIKAEILTFQPFHTVQKAKLGRAVYLAGPRGRTAVIHF